MKGISYYFTVCNSEYIRVCASFSHLSSYFCQLFIFSKEKKVRQVRESFMFIRTKTASTHFCRQYSVYYFLVSYELRLTIVICHFTVDYQGSIRSKEASYYFILHIYVSTYLIQVGFTYIYFDSYSSCNLDKNTYYTHRSPIQPNPPQFPSFHWNRQQNRTEKKKYFLTSLEKNCRGSTQMTFTQIRKRNKVSGLKIGFLK